MKENERFIVSSINRICLELSVIDQMLEKNADEELEKAVSVAYPFPVSIEELNCYFNTWKWGIIGEN
jgi:hypothetical protein